MIPDPWTQSVLTGLADAAIKGALLLSVAFIIAFALRHRSASVRHLVWAFSLAALLLLPAVSLLAPRWNLAILPPQSPQAAQPAPVETPSTLTPSDSLVGELALSPVDRAIDPTPIIQPPAPPTAPAPNPPSFTWPVLILILWGLGAIASLAPLAFGHFALRRLIRRARPMRDEPWLRLLDELKRTHGIRGDVALLLGGRAMMPMAAGWFRAAVILPDEAANWPPELARAVLAHELAHVARRDCLTHALARLAAALHWPDPLAWFALRQLRIERERACDDRALAAGAPPADYADHLLAIAREMNAPSLAATAAVTMARRSQLEGRLLAILDTAKNRAAASRRIIVACALFALALSLPLATLRLTAAETQPRDETKQAEAETPPQKTASSATIAQADAWYKRSFAINDTRILWEANNASSDGLAISAVGLKIDPAMGRSVTYGPWEGPPVETFGNRGQWMLQFAMTNNAVTTQSVYYQAEFDSPRSSASWSRSGSSGKRFTASTMIPPVPDSPMRIRVFTVKREPEGVGQNKPIPDEYIAETLLDFTTNVSREQVDAYRQFSKAEGFQIRRIADPADPNVDRFRSAQDSGWNGHPVLVAKDVILSNKDFTGGEPDRANPNDQFGQINLVLHLTPEAESRLNAMQSGLWRSALEKTVVLLDSEIAGGSPPMRFNSARNLLRVSVKTEALAHAILREIDSQVITATIQVIDHFPEISGGGPGSAPHVTRWRIDGDGPLQISHGWFTVMDGQMAGYVGTDRGTPATAPGSRYELEFTARRDEVELRLEAEAIRHENGNINGNVLDGKISIPGVPWGTSPVRRSQSATLRSDSYTALWMWSYSGSDSTTKTLIYAARLVGENDATQGFAPTLEDKPAMDSTGNLRLPVIGMAADNFREAPHQSDPATKERVQTPIPGVEPAVEAKIENHRAIAQFNEREAELVAVLIPYHGLFRPDGSPFDFDAFPLHKTAKDLIAEWRTKQEAPGPTRRLLLFTLSRRADDHGPPELLSKSLEPDNLRSVSNFHFAPIEGDNPKWVFAPVVELNTTTPLPLSATVHIDLAYGPLLPSRIELSVMSNSEYIFHGRKIVASVENLAERHVEGEEIPSEKRPQVTLQMTPNDIGKHFKIRALLRDATWLDPHSEESVPDGTRYGLGWPEPISRQNLERFVYSGRSTRRVTWRDVRMTPFPPPINDLIYTWTIQTLDADSVEILDHRDRQPVPFKLRVGESHGAIWKDGKTYEVKLESIDLNGKKINVSFEGQTRELTM